MPSERDYIDSGSALLNLMLTDSMHFGWRIGDISNVFGARKSGCSTVGMEAAGCHLRSNPKDRELNQVIYFQANKYIPPFSEVYANRMKLPYEKIQFYNFHEGNTPMTEVIQKIDSKLKDDQTALVVVDSIDDHFTWLNFRKDLSEVRRLKEMIKDTRIHLMLISRYEPYTEEPYRVSSEEWHTGVPRKFERELEYCSDKVLWVCKRGVDLVNRQSVYYYGFTAQLKLLQSNSGYPFRSVDIPILWESGFDDVRSMMDYVIEEQRLLSDVWLESDLLE